MTDDEKEYLWHPEVHACLGEELCFFFIRASFGAHATQALVAEVNKKVTSASTYSLIGPYDYLVRSWGANVENVKVREGLARHSSEHFGNCLSIQVRSIYYPFADLKPAQPALDEFVQAMQNSEASAASRHDWIEQNLERLKANNIILGIIKERSKLQERGLQAYTLIKNVKTHTDSRALMETCLKDAVKGYCIAKKKKFDATLYATSDGYDFMIRWHTPSIPDFVQTLKSLANLVEEKRGAMVFETYFVAEPLTPKRDNFNLLIKRDRSQAAPADEWAEVLPALAKVDGEHADYFRLTCRRPGINFSPSTVRESSGILKDALEAYLHRESARFAAHVSQFYSYFETQLRNLIVAAIWRPEEERGELENLKTQWKGILGKPAVPEGKDGGRTVPKLTLGDWVLLAKHYFSTVFEEATSRRLKELSTMRNSLAHYGPESVDLEYLPSFLAQAETCATLLRSIRKLHESI